MYTTHGREGSGSSKEIWERLLSSGAFDFGKNDNRIVLDFRATELGKPDGWESCGSDAGNEINVGDEWELVSVLKSDSEEVTACWERDLKEPKKCDFGGVEGSRGDVPSSYMISVDGVAYEELVAVEDMLGRELPGESRVLERVSLSDRDEKWPSTLGRHRQDEGLVCIYRSSD